MEAQAEKILASIVELQELRLRDIPPMQLFSQIALDLAALVPADRVIICKAPEKEDSCFRVIADTGIFQRDVVPEAWLPLSMTPAVFHQFSNSQSAGYEEDHTEVLSAAVKRKYPDLKEAHVEPLIDRNQVSGVIIFGRKGGSFEPAQLSAVGALTGFCNQVLHTFNLDSINKQNQIKLRNTIDSAMHGIVTIDHEGKIINFNRSAELMFDYPEWELKDRNVSILMPEEVSARHDTYLERYLETGEKRIIDRGREVMARRRDGSLFPAQLGVREMRIGRDRYFVGSIEDLTEAKQQQQALVDAKEKAEFSKTALSRFVQSMGHELRTPLNAIVALSQLLDSELVEKPEMRQQIAQIQTSSDHLVALINDIFDYSIIESEDIVLNDGEVDVQGLMRQCVQMISPRALKRGIQIVEQGVSSARVSVDEGKLKQVLLNLLTNAVKYNNDHGLIEYGCVDLAGDRVRFQVRDTGNGIPYEKQGRVFKAFDRLGAEQGVIEGTGIGLALSQKLTHLMKGTIGFESTPGSGSRFWVEFNVSSPAQDVLSNPSPESDTNGESKKEGLRLLYIEDNPVNVMVMEAIIEQEFEVTLMTATDGASGIELALSRPFDVILTDIHLPDMKGYDVLIRLKDVLPKTPIIAVSASAMSQEIRRGEEAGFAAYITKPINIEQFWGTVHEVCEKWADS